MLNGSTSAAVPTAGSVFRAVQELELRLKQTFAALEPPGGSTPGQQARTRTAGPAFVTPRSAGKDSAVLESPTTVLRNAFASSSLGSSPASSTGELESSLENLAAGALLPALSYAQPDGLPTAPSSGAAPRDGNPILRHLRRAEALLAEVPDAQELAANLARELDAYDVRTALVVSTKALQAERELLDAQLSCNAHAITAVAAMSTALHECDPACGVAIHMARLGVLDAASVDLRACRQRSRVLADAHWAQGAHKRANLRVSLNAMLPDLDVGPALVLMETEAEEQQLTARPENEIVDPASALLAEAPSNALHMQPDAGAPSRKRGFLPWLMAQLPAALAGAAAAIIVSRLTSTAAPGRTSLESLHGEARQVALSACTPQQLTEYGFKKVPVKLGHGIFTATSPHTTQQHSIPAAEQHVDDGFTKVAVHQGHSLFAG